MKNMRPLLANSVYSLIFILFSVSVLGAYYFGNTSFNNMIGTMQGKEAKEAKEKTGVQKLTVQNEDQGTKENTDDTGQVRGTTAKDLLWENAGSQDNLDVNDPFEGLSDEEIIQRLFSMKYDVPVKDVIVNIAVNINGYSRGGVSIKNILSDWYLTAKLDGEWEIVANGGPNVPVVCQVIAPYDFPGEVVPICFDLEREVMISRTGPDAPVTINTGTTPAEQ